MVAEDDGVEHLTVFSRFLLRRWEKGGLPFPQNYYRPPRKNLANDDWREDEGNRILLRMEKEREKGRDSVVVVDANGTLKNVLELADANAALRCIA